MADPVPDRAVTEHARRLVRLLEKRLKVPEHSLMDLIAENDWSLVIKGHALIEGAISILLTDTLDARLQSAFVRLPLSEAKIGKIEFARLLDLVSDEERKFVRLLSELRNKLAHDPRNLSFTFESYLTSLDANQKRNFLKTTAIDSSTLALFVTGPIDTKAAIFIGIMQIMMKAVAKLLQIEVEEVKSQPADQRKPSDWFT